LLSRGALAVLQLPLLLLTLASLLLFGLLPLLLLTLASLLLFGLLPLRLLALFRLLWFCLLSRLLLALPPLLSFGLSPLLLLALLLQSILLLLRLLSAACGLVHLRLICARRAIHPRPVLRRPDVPCVRHSVCVAFIALTTALGRLRSVAIDLRSRGGIATGVRAGAVGDLVAIGAILRATLPIRLFALRIGFTDVPREMRRRWRRAAFHDDLAVHDSLRRHTHVSARLTRTQSAFANGFNARSDCGRARDLSLIDANLAAAHALRRREGRARYRRHGARHCAIPVGHIPFPVVVHVGDVRAIHDHRIGDVHAFDVAVAVAARRHIHFARSERKPADSAAAD
jgi:hypothetical protein